jgi:hypothetical protein
MKRNQLLETLQSILWPRESTPYLKPNRCKDTTANSSWSASWAILISCSGVSYGKCPDVIKTTGCNIYIADEGVYVLPSRWPYVI